LVVESIGLSFDDFYFIIHPFKFSSMNGVIAVIEDTVAISSSILTKAFTDGWFMDRACEHYESRALTASLTSSKIDITFNRIPQILLKIVSGKPLEIINRHLFHARRKK
jgi:hypothetical protein